MTRKLAGSKILMVVAPEKFRDEELLEPKELFLAEGASVVVASSKQTPARGMLGASIVPDLIFAEAKAKNYDAVVVVGGMGSPKHLWDDVFLHKLIQDMENDGKVVAAICLSGAVLAKAGILKGKKATVWPAPEAIEALKVGGAAYVKTSVVRDGAVITADGPTAAKDFGNAVIDELVTLKAKI